MNRQLPVRPEPSNPGAQFGITALKAVPWEQSLHVAQEAIRAVPWEQSLHVAQEAIRAAKQTAAATQIPQSPWLLSPLQLDSGAHMAPLQSSAATHRYQTASVLDTAGSSTSASGAGEKDADDTKNVKEGKQNDPEPEQPAAPGALARARSQHKGRGKMPGEIPKRCREDAGGDTEKSAPAEGDEDEDDEDSTTRV